MPKDAQAGIGFNSSAASTASRTPPVAAEWQAIRIEHLRCAAAFKRSRHSEGLNYVHTDWHTCT